MESINFKLYLLFLAIANGVMGDSPTENDSGKDLSPIEMPYIVSLRTNGRHFCSGSIISHYHILTAAHCLSRKMYPYAFVKGKSYAVTGATQRNSNGTSHRLKYYQIHPDFTTHIVYDYKYDIAILTLYEKIEINEHQKIIRLPVSCMPAGSTGIAAGWNNVSVKQKKLNVLYKLNATVMNFDECYTYQPSGLNTQSVVCTLIKTGHYEGTCQGDGGGPFVVNNTLVGMTNDLGCGSGHAEIIPSVYFYTSWIKKSIRQTGVPGVTEDTPESDFYDEGKMEKLSL